MVKEQAATMSSMVCNLGLVLVEFEYEYEGRDGGTVSIKPNERYILLAKTNDHWWQVCKDDHARPFYIPAKYVKELPAEIPSPLDFADPPGLNEVLVPLPVPVPVLVPKHSVPDRVEEVRAGDEVTIRLRSPKTHKKTEHRMSTFGVPLEFHDPPPAVHKRGGLNDSLPGLHSHVAPDIPSVKLPPQTSDTAKYKKQLNLVSSLPFVSSKTLLTEDPLSLKSRVPSFSPADPLHRTLHPIPVDTPIIPNVEVTSRGGTSKQESLEKPAAPVELKVEVVEDTGDRSDSENIYESILDLELDKSPIISETDSAVILSALAEPTQLITPASPPPTQTQVENASPNTAVYAKIHELKKNTLKHPPVSSPSAAPTPDQEGWQVHTDEESGKEFYYHPITGQTTWANPGSPVLSINMELPKEVPAGLAPTSSPALSSTSSQGSNWEELLHDSTGRYYTYNPYSGATSWVSSEPLSLSSPVTLPSVLKNPDEGPPPLPEEDYPTENNKAPESSSSEFPRDVPAMLQGKRAPIPRASLDSDTPAGWNRSMDADGKTVFTSEHTQEQWLKSEDEKGKPYYYLRNGSQSQWTLPAELERSNTVSLPIAPILHKVGNGLDPDGPQVMRNWRQTMGPSQFSPSLDDTKFIPKHRRNISDISSEASSSGHSPEIPQNAHVLEKTGILNKTKLVDHGKKNRKNWSQSWTVLHDGILTFHKDPKSAPSGTSNKMSQIIPEITVELRGATVGWAPKDKSSKKNVLELKTRHGCEYLIQNDTESTVCDWHKVLLDSIRQQDLDHRSDEEEEEPIEKAPPTLDRDKGTSSTKSTSGISVDSSDQGRVRTKLRRFLQRRPTLQSVKEKGYIRDNVFGCHLDTLCHRENSTVPKFVEKCIRAVERRGLDIDGIYRVSGNLAVIQRLRHKADHEENLDLEDGQWEEIHVITGALKLFLRELPEPLFPYSFFDKFIAAIQVQDYSQKVSYFCDLVRSLPLPNHDTMHLLFKHLLKVVEFGEKNRMSVQSMAIVFGPTLLRPQTESANITVHMVFQNQIVELILNEFQKVFAPS
ncbi:hypothetical protein UPYG_G00101060 [Umbra pygmaea]|uniref:Rho GTPase-activating protein 27-like n=1 Tax=Umbra pygmaea TaxID=75934 RepID=A0ABD0X0T3_UMBPY